MKRFLLSLLTIILISSGLDAQQLEECGTILTQEQESYLNKTRKLRQEMAADKSAQTTIYIPVQHHVVQRTNGTGGISQVSLAKIMTELNHYYADEDMYFYECDAVNYINDDTYFDFNNSQESSFCGTHDVSNKINIYYFNTVTSGSSALCGYSRFPPSVDRVIMRNSCAINGSTIVHEIGHYFSLYHTHGKTNTGTTLELVNGSNCSYEGDDICDTPADPNLSGKVSGTCAYTGTGLDANNQPYAPQTENIMSYSRKNCRMLLTSGQLARAGASAAIDRYYLGCSSPQKPSAEFVTSTAKSCDGIVGFYDRSTSLPTNWSWTFGDGNGSMDQHPTHRYTSSGSYTVKLTAWNTNGTDSITKTAIVDVNLPNVPNAATPDSVCYGFSANLSAAGGNEVYWYADETSSAPIANGFNFTTGAISTDTVFYASARYNKPSINVGALDNTIGGGSYYTSYEYLIFDAHKPFTLNSVKVYSNSAGNRTIQLRDNYGLLIQDTTVYLSNGSQRVTLNFNVPAGLDLQLGTSVISDVDLFCNITGAAYPYSIGDVLDITASSDGTSSYYLFYDWKIQEADCESNRLAVDVYLKDCTSGLHIQDQLSKIQLMPNPSNGQVSIVNENFSSLIVIVRDMMGNEVQSDMIGRGKNSIDLSHLSKGVYLVSYRYEDHQYVQKLVRN